MKLFVIALIFVFVGCSGKRVVNPDSSTPPLIPGENGYLTSDPPQASAPIAGQSFNDYMQRSPRVGISGNLYLKGDIPTPLGRIQLALFQLENGKWNEISRLSTELDGSFSFTRKLYEGDYQIQVMDSRFSGRMSLKLSSSPQKDLILMAESVKK